jgi:hypothetical protein
MQFHSFSLYSQKRLITFHLFSFLYFKTFKQDRLVQFHYILLHSSPFIRLIPYIFLQKKKKKKKRIEKLLAM